MYTIDYILNKGKDNDYDTESLAQISTAYKFATNAHEGQNRLNGEPEMNHVLTVAGIVADLNVDATTIVAALLHETVFLSDVSLELLKEKFGADVANIVDNLSKLRKLKLTDHKESSSIYLRKVLVGISEDVRVLIIKLADRLHNMRTCDVLPEEKRKQKAMETSEVLIPIAHRLGINSIKSELEDLSLKHSKPEIYNEILEKLNDSRGGLTESLEEMKNGVSEILISHNVNFQIKARLKSVHSIYTKLTTGRKWSDIYDILAMRLILPTEADCYMAVGLIHAQYRPIPKRFKDFIAMPKENMYQSLHTSVFGVDGHIFEIQLRTPEMDELAENGVASHWSYKEKGIVVQNFFEQKLELFRNIIESNKEETNDEVFIKNMSDEFLSTQIYVFTPKGDVIELPQGSTPIDFAYRVHSEVGDKTVSAIVNEQIVPLNYELSDGDIIKINTSNQAKPSIEWLSIVKTPQAKNKIKSYFSKQDRERYILRGKDLLDKEVRKQKLAFNDILSDDNIQKVINELKLSNHDELLLNIGSLRYTAGYIIDIIKENRRTAQDILLDRVRVKDKEVSTKKINYKNNIIVANTDNILVSVAGCCNPLPGDEIIGYITKGSGVTVHKTNCSNIVSINQRLIHVEWNGATVDKLFNTRILIETNIARNSILEIVTKANLSNIHVQSIKELPSAHGDNYEVYLQVKTRNDLNNYISDLKGLAYVTEVKE